MNYRKATEELREHRRWMRKARIERGECTIDDLMEEIAETMAEMRKFTHGMGLLAAALHGAPTVVFPSGTIMYRGR